MSLSKIYYHPQSQYQNHALNDSKLLAKDIISEKSEKIDTANLISSFPKHFLDIVMQLQPSVGHSCWKTPIQKDGNYVTLEYTSGGTAILRSYFDDNLTQVKILKPTDTLYPLIHKGLEIADTDYFAKLNEWKKLNPSPSEDREEFVSRVIYCMATHSKLLDVSNLGITFLPPLPDSITELNASYNKLIAISDLPKTLKKLTIWSNQIIYLPEDLPAELEILNAGNNLISYIPSLPKKLQKLDLSYNNLETIIALPDTVTTFIANTNNIKKIFSFPASMKTLEIANNELKYLPNFPENTTKINVGRNKLTAIPPLPKKIYSLNFSHNLVTQAPVLPTSLREIDARFNMIEKLPVLNTTVKHVDFTCNNLLSIPLSYLRHSSDWHF